MTSPTSFILCVTVTRPEEILTLSQVDSTVWSLGARQTNLSSSDGEDICMGELGRLASNTTSMAIYLHTPVSGYLVLVKVTKNTNHGEHVEF